MENLLSAFQKSLHNLGVHKNDRLILAVSGGLDSVVLTYLCQLSFIDFGIAHANFQLRGDESERDESFVRQMATKLQVPIFIKKFDTIVLTESEKISVQEAARKLRYKWFDTLIGISPNPYKFLITAHQKDDNIETMLMHFFRGTGIAGLTGMPEKKGHLIRPLLKFSRQQINEFALRQELKWVDDSSNAANKYTRNFFRNQLIPSVSHIFPDLYQNLENNLYRFSEANILYQQAVEFHRKKLLHLVGSEIHIPILRLKKANPLKTILFEIFREYRFRPSQTNEIIRLMDGDNGKYVSSVTHRVIKNRRWLIIAPVHDEKVTHIVVDNESRILYPEGEIRVELKSLKEAYRFPDLRKNECVDAEKIKFPLILRKWKAGDYFYPLGMKKKKKIARFLIDQKLSKTAKEKVWVLVMDSQIIWVVGQRIDNRFQINNNTRTILKLQNEETIIR